MAQLSLNAVEQGGALMVQFPKATAELRAELVK